MSEEDERGRKKLVYPNTHLIERMLEKNPKLNGMLGPTVREIMIERA